MSLKWSKWYLVLLAFVVLFFVLFSLTGFLGFGDIDKKDLRVWERSGGVIVGADSFELDGSNETCWIIIHGYTDTPHSMRGVSDAVNSEFGDYVFAPRLLGHAEVPSELLDYTLEDWYLQVSEDFDRLSERCDAVNVLGFSFGGALSLKLAEEKRVKNVYLVAPYLKPTYRWYAVLPSKVYLDMLGDLLVYFKKSQVAKVNSPEGLKTHIAYWSFAFEPVKYSGDFLDVLRENIEKVDSPILLQHSKGDSVASYKMSEKIFERVESEIKDIVLYERSEHVILADYDKEDVIEEVVSFERENR